MSALAIASNSSKGANSRRQDETKWCKPDLRQVKVNVDGSFSADSLLGSVGAVLRDSNGKFIAGVAIYFPHMASAKLAEARAMKEGLILANQMGCSDIIAESDSIDIVEACSGDMRWFDEAAAVFADCVDLCTLIGRVKFKHCFREANSVAHELARHGLSTRSTCTWVDEPPSFLLPSILNDVTIM
jgi:ribonuclease HI